MHPSRKQDVLLLGPVDVVALQIDNGQRVTASLLLKAEEVDYVRLGQKTGILSLVLSTPENPPQRVIDQELKGELEALAASPPLGSAE